MRFTSGNARRKKSPSAALQNYLGDTLSFEALEAYKLLRTNLNFCVQNDDGCVCLGVTSSVAQEGKSTTAVNLAYVLAENGHKVCLIEGGQRARFAIRESHPVEGANTVLLGLLHHIVHRVQGYLLVRSVIIDR